MALSSMTSNTSPVYSIMKEDEAIFYLLEAIQFIANNAIDSRGVFIIGLSGGSLVNCLSNDGGLPSLKTDWSRWKIFLCDERIVPESDPESTYGLYKKLLFSKLPQFPASDNFLAANVSLPTIEEVAQDYEARLRQLWNGQDQSNPSYGMADCLVLGVGPDGHTCSLFPNHAALGITNSWITYLTDSPKPPPSRITLTYPFINKAAHILISGIGIQKVDIAERVQIGEDLPIARVHNPGGLVEWIIGCNEKATDSDQ